MLKGVDLIQRIQNELIEGYPTGNLYIGVTEEEYEELDKELKALEIVKEKKVNAWILAICNEVGVYNAAIPNDIMKRLTLEEFDLLKEVL